MLLSMIWSDYICPPYLLICLAAVEVAIFCFAGFATVASPLTANNMSGQGPNVNTGNKFDSIHPLNTGSNCVKQDINSGNQVNNQGNRGQEFNNYGNLSM